MTEPPPHTKHNKQFSVPIVSRFFCFPGWSHEGVDCLQWVVRCVLYTELYGPEEIDINNGSKLTSVFPCSKDTHVCYHLFLTIELERGTLCLSEENVTDSLPSGVISASWLWIAILNLSRFVWRIFFCWSGEYKYDETNRLATGLWLLAIR